MDRSNASREKRSGLGSRKLERSGRSSRVPGLGPGTGSSPWLRCFHTRINSSGSCRDNGETTPAHSQLSCRRFPSNRNTNPGKHPEKKTFWSQERGIIAALVYSSGLKGQQTWRRLPFLSSRTATPGSNWRWETEYETCLSHSWKTAGRHRVIQWKTRNFSNPFINMSIEWLLKNYFSSDTEKMNMSTIYLLWQR